MSLWTKSCGAVTIQMKLLKMPIFSHGTISFLTFYKKKIWKFCRNWTLASSRSESVNLASRISFTAAGLAQSVERLTAEREVAGSIPGARPILRVLKITEK